jgi:ankyrin repeat protein
VKIFGISCITKQQEPVNHESTNIVSTSGSEPYNSAPSSPLPFQPLSNFEKINLFARNRSHQHQIEHNLRKELGLKNPKQAKVISLLREHGANPEAVSAKHGNSALHALASSQKTSHVDAEKIIEFLEASLQLDFNKKNKNGDTPLHVAVKKQSNVCKLFFRQNTDVTARNSDGESVLSIAKDKYLETKKTALFSYKKPKLNKANSSHVLVNEYLKTKEIYRLALENIASVLNVNTTASARKGKERERTVRFIEPIFSFESRATTPITSFTKQLEEAQGVIVKQKRHIDNLEHLIIGFSHLEATPPGH